MTTYSLSALLPGFSDELLKEAGLKALVAKMPDLVRSLPAKSRKVVDKANLAVADLAAKHPDIYRDLLDPSPGPVGMVLKKLRGL